MKSEVIMLAGDDQIGDAIAAMGAVQYVASMHDTVYLQTANRDIELLMRPNNVRPAFEAPNKSTMYALNLSIGRAINQYGRKFSPVHALLHTIGYHPEVYVKPTIVPDIKRFYYTTSNEHDVLIAPWARGPERSMQPSQVLQLCGILANFGVSVGVLIGNSDTQLEAYPNASVYAGFVFGCVASMIDQAKCVVTVDSGPSRLAHAVLDDGRKHIILAPKDYPIEWTTYDGCQWLMQRDSGEWDMTQLVEMTLRCVKDRCAQAS